MAATATPTVTRAATGDAQLLTSRLVALIEHERLSIARAARNVGLPLEDASRLIRLHAIELEAAEIELDERLAPTTSKSRYAAAPTPQPYSKPDTKTDASSSPGGAAEPSATASPPAKTQSNYRTDNPG